MEMLEDLIVPRTIGASTIPPPPAAAAVTQAWIRLRVPGQDVRLVKDSLLLLALNARYLHVGESQVRLLISVLKSVAGDVSPAVQILGSVRASAAVVISIWVRRSLLNPSATGSPSASATLGDVGQTFCEILEGKAADSCVRETILLLGAVCDARDCRGETRVACQRAIVEGLTSRKKIITSSSPPSLAKVLAGVGYAMMGASEDSVRALLTGCVIHLWTSVDQRASLESCEMLSTLYEFLGSWMISLQQRLSVKGLWEPLVAGRGNLDGALQEVANIKVAMATGLLRGAKGSEIAKEMRGSLESLIAEISAWLLKEIITETGLANNAELLQRLAEHHPLLLCESVRHQLRCVSFSIGSCRNLLEAQPATLSCLLATLFGDVLDLSQVYLVKSSRSTTKVDTTFEELNMRVDGPVFKEVGSLARAVCEHYLGVTSVYQQQTELFFWKYASNLYSRHRTVVALLSGDKVLDDQTLKNKNLEKVTEAVFFTIVLFFSSSTDMLEKREELAAYLLDSFSCLEYFRRVQLDEFADAVKKCAALVSRSSKAASRLVDFLPCYEQVISWPGGSTLENPNYTWFLDEVQNSRLLFHFRILPSCLQQLDDKAFESRVVPLIFLYICHPSKQVADAAHKLFASFVSQKPDSGREVSLAEQLGAFYIKRAMEGYPDFTSFDGLVTGVTAMVRCLPAGSVTIRHCIDQLYSKTENLISSSANLHYEAADIDDAAAKIQEFLLHLLVVVDIQVLPHLMQKLSKLILRCLPPAAQKRVLEQVFGVIVACDDHVRKQSLVSWLQSLSYFLSGQQTSRL